MPEYYFYRLVVLVHVTLNNVLQFTVKDYVFTHTQTIISPDISSKSHSPFAYRSSREVLKKKSLQIFLTV